MATRAVPWVEKYRPKTVTDVAHQTEVVDTLRKAVETRNLPHLIFYGPPGTGKTSTILACARDLYGSDFKKRVLELNASDERGISIVRNKIKSFAMVAVNAKTNSEYAPRCNRAIASVSQGCACRLRAQLQAPGS